MHIEIPASRQIDPTIDGISLERKTRFAGYIIDYIENNLPRYAAGSTENKPSLFEYAREKGPDREMKFTLIERFNEKPSRFPNQNFNSQFDLGIACDLLLDLLRYEDNEILNPVLVYQDYKQTAKNNQLYCEKDLYKRIKNNFFVLIVKEIFKLIVKAKEYKQFKSCSTVGQNLANALIREDQSAMERELAKVMRNVIAVMTGSVDESMGLSSQRSSTMLN